MDLNYILSAPVDGGAVFTIACPAEAAKAHAPFYTYRVEHVAATDRWPEAYFVRVQRSPSDKQFVYLGKLNTYTGQVELTSASAFPAHSFRLRLVNRVLARLWSNDLTAITHHGYSVYTGGYRPVKRKRRRKGKAWRQTPPSVSITEPDSEPDDSEPRSLYL